jgi:hypothetical protein
VSESPPAAEGWYRDPYGIHQDRWFSAGNPTSLVRDQGTEGHDDPPGYPPPGPPAEIPDIDRFPGDDFRRADQAEANVGRDDGPRTFDRAFNAELPGFSGNETG